MLSRFNVRTSSRSEFLNITRQVQDAVDNTGIKNGICQVYISHTTAGVTINENADPDVKTDLINTLEKIVPWHGGYRHMEGNSAAHLKSSLMGFSVCVPIDKGTLVLGTWQSIYFCEFDGPRTRNVYVNIIGG